MIPEEPEVGPSAKLFAAVPDGKFSNLRLWLRTVEEVLGGEPLVLQSLIVPLDGLSIARDEAEGLEDMAVGLVRSSGAGDELLVLGDLNAGEFASELPEDIVIPGVVGGELLLGGRGARVVLGLQGDR